MWKHCNDSLPVAGGSNLSGWTAASREIRLSTVSDRCTDTSRSRCSLSPPTQHTDTHGLHWWDERLLHWWAQSPGQPSKTTITTSGWKWEKVVSLFPQKSVLPGSGTTSCDLWTDWGRRSSQAGIATMVMHHKFKTALVADHKCCGFCQGCRP